MADEMIADAGATSTDANPVVETAAKTEAAPTTLIDSGGEGAQPVVATDAADPAKTADADKPWYADDWREKLAAGDDKMLAQLKRYSSLANYVKAGYDAQQKIRSGEFKKPLAADAKPEDIAAYRKENGIPDEPTGYEFDLKGYVPPEADKPILDSFKQMAHAELLPPDKANKLVSWYYAQQEAALVAQAEFDKKSEVDTMVELRTEMGPDFKPNMNAIQNFLDKTATPDLAKMLSNARLPNGRMLGNDPDGVRWLASLAREVLPGAELMPAGTPQVGKGVEARIGEIEAMMRTEDGHREYWNSPTLQTEYRNLMDARTRQTARAA